MAPWINFGFSVILFDGGVEVVRSPVGTAPIAVRSSAAGSLPLADWGRGVIRHMADEGPPYGPWWPRSKGANFLGGRLGNLFNQFNKSPRRANHPKACPALSQKYSDFREGKSSAVPSGTGTTVSRAQALFVLHAGHNPAQFAGEPGLTLPTGPTPAYPDGGKEGNSCNELQQSSSRPPR